MFQNRLKEIQSQTEAEKEWWEKRRASIQSEFMKELDTSTATTAKSSDDDAVLVESANGTGNKKGKK